MNRALEKHAVRSRDVSLINQQYLQCCTNTTDPTIVWGTEVDAEELLHFVHRYNETSASLVSLPHVLIRAVAGCLARFPQLNCRVIGGRIHRFREVNVRIIHFDPRSHDVNILTVPQANRLDLEAISQSLWQTQLRIASGEYADDADKHLLNRGPVWMRRCLTRGFWWLDRSVRLPRVGRIDRHLDSSVVVNYLGHAGAPPMRAYKPSKFPDESSLLSITMGKVEPRPVVHQGQLAVRRVAPLFIRADHRVTDAHELSHFVSQLCQSLEAPSTLQEPAHADSQDQRAA